MKKITLIIVALFAFAASYGQIMITHSLSQTINDGDEIACADTGTGVFRDNNMFRDFDLVNDFGITMAFEVVSVDIPFGPVSTPTGFPVTVNIYSMDVANVFPDDWPAEATLEGTTVYNATDADAQSLVNVPISAVIPEGSRAIYELVIVDDGTDTHVMRFGCNLDGQTGPFWIQAADCGAATPLDLELAFGLPNAIVMNMWGDEVLGVDDTLAEATVIYPNPVSDVLTVDIPGNVEVSSAKLYDILGKDTGVRLIDGTMNTSNLARGVYILDIQSDFGSLTQKIVKQ